MKYRITEWLNYETGEMEYWLEHRVFFFWVRFAKTDGKTYATCLLEFLEELRK
jgi:hypothetical protein